MNDDKYSKYKTQQGFSSWQEERKYLENKWGKQGRQIHPMNYKEKLKKLKLQIQKLQKIGGMKSIVPTEGIVFKYKGKVYKFTGAFAPINQILGSLKFG